MRWMPLEEEQQQRRGGKSQEEEVDKSKAMKGFAS